MKKVSKEKSINPIAWVPTAYFAMGASFYSGKSRFHVHVQGLRNIRYPNCLLDFCHHVTVDIKVPLESFFRNVSYEKIFSLSSLSY